MRLVPILLTMLLLAGCSGGRMSQADKDLEIKEGLDRIEQIKRDPTMSPQLKRDMIEKAQMEVDALRGEES